MSKWNFLRVVAASDGQVGSTIDTSGTGLPMTAADLAAMRTVIGGNVAAFEQSLQDMWRIPENFRQMMAPIEAAVANLDLVRRQLAASEAQLARESLSATTAQRDLDRLAEVTDRLQRDLLI